MSYRIETAPPGRHLHEPGPAAVTIVLVGCGGTGSFLAEGLCRLLIGRQANLWLVDMDRVTRPNVGRQAFDRADVGRFKAQVLAERLSRRFGREIGYAVQPYEPTLHATVFQAPARLRLLIGAVDNAAARRMLADTLTRNAWSGARISAGAVWWLDCGNGRNSGQVLLGNAVQPRQLRGAFSRDEGLCRALPAPSLQRPDLLTAATGLAPARNCAEAVVVGDQGPTINQVVAAMASNFVDRLLSATCVWMANYFDMDDGLMRCVPAEPKTVAGLVGLHVNALVQRSHDSHLI